MGGTQENERVNGSVEGANWPYTVTYLSSRRKLGESIYMMGKNGKQTAR